jgi:hypothetical protein
VWSVAERERGGNTRKIILPACSNKKDNSSIISIPKCFLFLLVSYAVDAIELW